MANPCVLRGYPAPWVGIRPADMVQRAGHFGRVPQVLTRSLQGFLTTMACEQNENQGLVVKILFAQLFRNTSIK